MIQKSICEAFMGSAVKRVNAIRHGNPLDMNTMTGAQAFSEQLGKILR